MADERRPQPHPHLLPLISHEPMQRARRRQGVVNEHQAASRRPAVGQKGWTTMTLRLVGAAALLVSAGVHLYLWFDGVRNQSVGPMFLVNVVSGVIIAALLIFWRHWLAAFLTVGFGLATLGAFTIASTVGLLGVHTEWRGGSVWAAAIAEVVCIVTGATLLVRQAPVALHLPTRHGKHA